MPVPQITELRAIPVSYWSVDGMCEGTNLLYLRDGKPASSRVPWRVFDPGAEVLRLNRLERTLAQKKGGS